MNTYAIAINRAFSGKAPFPAPDGFWRGYNGQFRNEQVTAQQFAESVHAGYGYTTWHADYRKAENFVLGQHIALDFDTGDERSTIDTLLSDDFIARFAGLIYTTPSHTPQAPRARVVFFLDRPIRNPHKYTLLARSLLWRYGAADETCKDACRLFYGSIGCDYELTDNILTLEDAALHLVNPYKAHIAIVEREREEARQRARAQYGDVQADDTMKAAYINRAFDNEYDTVSRALTGDRHKQLLDAAIRLGGLLKAGWVPSGLVSEQRIIDTLMDAATKNGIVAKYGDADPLRAITNGIGYAAPRDEPIWKRNEEGGAVAVSEAEMLSALHKTKSFRGMYAAYQNVIREMAV